VKENSTTLTVNWTSDANDNLRIFDDKTNTEYTTGKTYTKEINLVGFMNAKFALQYSYTLNNDGSSTYGLGVEVDNNTLTVVSLMFVARYIRFFVPKTALFDIHELAKVATMAIANKGYAKQSKNEIKNNFETNNFEIFKNNEEYEMREKTLEETNEKFSVE